MNDFADFQYRTVPQVPRCFGTTRAHAGARTRARQKSRAQWEIPRYLAVLAVLNQGLGARKWQDRQATEVLRPSPRRFGRAKVLTRVVRTQSCARKASREMATVAAACGSSLGGIESREPSRQSSPTFAPVAPLCRLRCNVASSRSWTLGPTCATWRAGTPYSSRRFPVS